MRLKVFFFVTLFLLVIGCKKQTDLGSDGKPKELLFAIYGGDNPAQFKSAIEPFRLHLEKKLGIKVTLFFSTNYAAVIQALRSKKVHMAEITPFAYIIASQKPGLLPIATIGRAGKPSLYRSFIFTNPNTGIKSLGALKLHASDLTLCFSDPASASGHLIPRAYLTSIGLDPSKAFKQTMFAGNHASSILNVKSGKVDVGCSSSDLTYDKLVREGIIKREDIVTLWESPPIINNAIVMREELNIEFIDEVRTIYLNIAKENYPAFSAYAKLYYPNPVDMGYVPAYDSMYNSLREIAGDIKDINLLDKKK